MCTLAVRRASDTEPRGRGTAFAQHAMIMLNSPACCDEDVWFSCLRTDKWPTGQSQANRNLCETVAKTGLERAEGGRRGVIRADRQQDCHTRRKVPRQSNQECASTWGGRRERGLLGIVRNETETRYAGGGGKQK
eukprot:6213178-Pleurochrysis_carterae.AAC.6